MVEQDTKTHTTKHYKGQRLPRALNQYRIEEILQSSRFYRKFIKGYTHITKLLTDLANVLERKVRVELTQEARKAFQKIKNELIKEPVLVLPDITRLFKLRIDVSKYVRGVLFQRDAQGKERLIALGSES